MSSPMVKRTSLFFVLRVTENWPRSPRWRKYRTIKTKQAASAAIHAKPDVFIRLLTADTASDPKIEWPLIAALATSS